jgi:hypothetical protein
MDDWNDILRSQLALAEKELTDLSDRSLCEISREGGSQSAAIKWAEGRWVALRDLRTVTDRASLLNAIERDIARMTSDREKDRGPSWDSYLRGGIESLTQLRGRLHITAS